MFFLRKKTRNFYVIFRTLKYVLKTTPNLTFISKHTFFYNDIRPGRPETARAELWTNRAYFSETRARAARVGPGTDWASLKKFLLEALKKVL